MHFRGGSDVNRIRPDSLQRKAPGAILYWTYVRSFPSHSTRHNVHKATVVVIRPDPRVRWTLCDRARFLQTGSLPIRSVSPVAGAESVDGERSRPPRPTNVVQSSSTRVASRVVRVDAIHADRRAVDCDSRSPNLRMIRRMEHASVDSGVRKSPSVALVTDLEQPCHPRYENWHVSAVSIRSGCGGVELVASVLPLRSLTVFPAYRLSQHWP
jgi:hypothetical protein